jgi:plastocyanin
MTRRHLAALAALTAIALGVSACGSDNGTTGATETTTETGTTGAGTTLQGTVGPGFTIALTQDGQDVSTLTAGTYTLNIDDMSTAHNFHLTGPGVDESTEVSFEGTKTVDVALESGTYTFVCDPHADSMNGSFEVTG